MADKTEGHQIVNCDENGDAILVINEKVHVRVSTKVLSVASSTFRSLFNGRFAEGQHLNSTDPPRIAITEDSTEIMVLLCRLLHWNTEIPRKIDLDTLFGLSLMADKRDCCIILRPYAYHVWAWSGLLRKDLTDLLKGLNISLLMQEADAFKGISNRLCMETDSAVQLVKLFKEVGDTPRAETLMQELLALYQFLQRHFSDTIRSASIQRTNLLIDFGCKICSDNNKQAQKDNFEEVHMACWSGGTLASVVDKVGTALRNYPVEPAHADDGILDMFLWKSSRLKLFGLCLECFCQPGAVMQYGPHSHVAHSPE